MIGADGEENVPHREWLIAYDRVVNEVKAELAKQGRADEFVGSKVHTQTDPRYICVLITSVVDHL